MCDEKGDCGRLRPCACVDQTHNGEPVRGCGHRWETDAPEVDQCPRCGEWRTVKIERCYECPLSALEESMDTARGALINRAFRKLNLMKAGIHFTLDDVTVEEARVIEMIEQERPMPKLPGQE